MWSRLDDTLIDHPKLFAAGAQLGQNGPAIALGFFCAALMWTNKHLTDGFLPSSALRTLRHVQNPARVADALLKAVLFEKVDGGFRIHDFHEYNPTAKDVRDKRAWDRARKELYSDPELLDQIRKRDQDCCRYCGRPVNWKDRRGPGGGQYDHVEPRGANTLENVVVACRSCNMTKGNRPLSRTGLVLRPPPGQRLFAKS